MVYCDDLVLEVWRDFEMLHVVWDGYYEVVHMEAVAGASLDLDEFEDLMSFLVKGWPGLTIFCHPFYDCCVFLL